MPDHVTSIPMRWADLDQLNHVNNVVYLDYAAQARGAMVDDGALDVGPTRQVTVRFERPLLLGSRPVVVTSSESDGVLTQRIGVDGTDAVFATVTSVLGDADPGTPVLDDADAAEAWLRRSDVGADGTVGQTRLFELLQESRILYFSRRLPARQMGRFVVGTLAVDLGAPIGWRREPLTARSRITRVGDGSFDTVTELWGDDVLHARCRSTLVGFDLTKQSSRRFDDDEKAMLHDADA